MFLLLSSFGKLFATVQLLRGFLFPQLLSSCMLQAHSNYVDCVRLLDDDLILTKSVNDQIALWRPHPRSADTSGERGLIDLIAVRISSPRTQSV
jgi:hypothetical protein